MYLTKGMCFIKYNVPNAMIRSGCIKVYKQMRLTMLMRKVLFLLVQYFLGMSWEITPAGGSVDD